MDYISRYCGSFGSISQSNTDYNSVDLVSKFSPDMNHSSTLKWYKNTKAINWGLNEIIVLLLTIIFLIINISISFFAPEHISIWLRTTRDMLIKNVVLSNVNNDYIPTHFRYATDVEKNNIYMSVNDQLIQLTEKAYYIYEK